MPAVVGTCPADAEHAGAGLGHGTIADHGGVDREADLAGDDAVSGDVEVLSIGKIEETVQDRNAVCVGVIVSRDGTHDFQNAAARINRRGCVPIGASIVIEDEGADRFVEPV